jgi:hypothetical protein
MSMTRVPRLAAGCLAAAAVLVVVTLSAVAPAATAPTRLTEADEQAYVGGLLCHVCSAVPKTICLGCKTGNITCAYDPSTKSCRDITLLPTKHAGCSLQSPFFDCTFSVLDSCDPRGTPAACGVPQAPVCPAPVGKMCPPGVCAAAATGFHCDLCK